MNRLQKKCILASVLLHGLLLLVILFGAAFIKKPPPTIPKDRINIIPSRFVDSAMSGGGGDPKLARTDERVKGDTLAPQPPTPVAPPTPKPPTPQPPVPTPTPPRPETRKPEPAKPLPAKPLEVPKPNLTKAPVTPKLELTPTIRNNNTKAREKEEAAAREAARQDANFRREMASRIQPTTGLKAGFRDGTKVDVLGGPGGQAYANYAVFVREAYDNAWQVMPDLASQDYSVSIEVTVSRTGRVLSHRIVNRSGNSGMDRSIQRALDKVKASGLPAFPAESSDSERTFSIEFNLKAKRLVG